MRKRRREQTRHLNDTGPLSDEHLLNLAKQAVKKARIPLACMNYDEQISSAMFGIAVGLKKFEVERWQSLREWLSMQGLFQLRSDAKQKTAKTMKEAPSDNLDWAESKTPTPLEMLISDEKSAELEKVLSRLPRRQRNIVRRVAINGEKFSAVAKKLRLPRGAVIRDYRRALKVLSASFQPPPPSKKQVE